MEKHECIAGLAGARRRRRVTGRAQQPAMPVINFTRPHNGQKMERAFRRIPRRFEAEADCLSRDVTIEYSWAEGQSDRLPALAARIGSAPSLRSSQL